MNATINSDKIKKIEAKIKKGDEDINDYFELGSSYLNNGAYHKLIELYGNIKTIKLTELDKAKILYEKAQAHQFLKNDDDAKELLEKALNILEEEKESLDALDLLSLIQYNKFLLSDNSQDAIKHGMNAVDCLLKLLMNYEIDEDGYLTNSHVADIYHNLGKYKKALKYYNIALERSDYNFNKVFIMSGIAAVYGSQGKTKKAIYYYEKALIKANESVPVTKIYYDMGKLYFENDFYVEAEKSFNNAIENIDDDPRYKNNQEYKIDIYWHLGTIAYEIDNYDNSIRYLNKVINEVEKTHPYFSNSHLTIGHIYLAKGKYTKAIDYYNKVISSANANSEEKEVAKETLSQIPFNA